jgi:alkaline phosphatase
MMKRRMSLLCLFVALFFCSASSSPEVPRNIVLMIGDGMGLSHVTAGRTHKGSLALDGFKTIGLVLTHANGDDYITDSAASATALATGIETYNGAIGMGPDSTARETLFEAARERGMKTGVVVACSVTHATPAAFIAHVPLRSMEFDIAEQISRGETDVILGGGWGWFLPQDRRGSRKDGQDLVRAMQQRGYTYVSSDTEFAALDWKRSKKVLGLFAENHPEGAPERTPSLSRMTAAALEFLSASKRGFILMVEGSQIDWAGHDNDADQLLAEMDDFDDAIREVVEFARKHTDTLVIVTADHETGGYALVGGSLKQKSVLAKFATNDHTGTMVPLFASGPGAGRFGGIQPNTHVGKTILELLRVGRRER